MVQSKRTPSSNQFKGGNVPFLLLFLLCLLWSAAPLSSASAEWNFSGQISGWGGYYKEGGGSAGLRFLPRFTFESPLSEGLAVDGEFILNLRTRTTFSSFAELEDNTHGDLYRSWVRLSGERSEIRLGLQRINFGPARLLRSLQWFDSLDPRDPLEVTEGVWAILARTYFQNNSSLWLWGLYGNDDLKGLERFTSDEHRPEYGLRYQFPVAKGEMAFTWHTRRLDREFARRHGLPRLTDGRENRWALDGTFDLGPGVWFEAAASHISIDSSDSLWTKYLTVGADYTFNIGSGLHVIGEHFIRSEEEEDFMTSALSLDYSLGILDTLTFIAFFDWQEHELSPSLSWQRTLDDWLFNVTAFYNSGGRETDYSGTGILLTISYNF